MRNVVERMGALVVTLYTTLYTTLHTTLHKAVHTSVQALGSAAPTRRRLAARRGVTIVEYVLIAVVVLGVAVVFRDQLAAAIANLVTRITNFLNG